MLSRDFVLNLISEEKEKYSSYSQLCSFFKVKPDPIVIATSNARIGILEKILKVV